MRDIVEGAATPAQVGAFLTALRMKGETIEETAAFASAMMGYCLKIHPSTNGRLLDTCGTGGDQIKTFNVSTISAFVAAGAGVVVAKHGNRSVTSKCGSADLLEKLGFNVGMPAHRVQESVEQVGIGFMFAPAFHPAMKQVAPVRKELGIRTLFNLIGPMINPANVQAQLVGVYSPFLTEYVAKALGKLGREEAIVVHGLEGMDEISVTGRTLVSWLRDGEVQTKEYAPTDFGLARASDENVFVSSLDESVRTAISILSGSSQNGAEVDMVLANAAAAIVLARKANSFPEAIGLARASIKTGNAYDKLERMITFSGGDAAKLEELGRNNNTD